LVYLIVNNAFSTIKINTKTISIMQLAYLTIRICPLERRFMTLGGLEEVTPLTALISADSSI
jgi:hypothetical protein